MTYLTLFSAPKPFTNPHIAMIQRNAIRSWLELGEEIQIVLVGSEEGLPQIALEFGITLLENVKRNELGTPLVSAIFELARNVSDAPLLAYVNGDILLLPDFLQAVKRVKGQLERFLIVSSRWDLQVSQLLDFSADWQARLWSDLNQHGRRHPPAGSDIFVFPRAEFSNLPDFAIGRAGWDNWMIYHALHSGIDVVDATQAMTVIHQNHDYSHLPDGKPHYDLPESQTNMRLGGGIGVMYTILDSNKRLVNGKIKGRSYSLLHLSRRLELWLMPEKQPRQGWRWTIARRLRRWRRQKLQVKDD
ncbi:MAG: hypothetical protein ACPL3P_08770 [Anaerolineales bacterium]